MKTHQVWVTRKNKWSGELSHLSVSDIMPQADAGAKAGQVLRELDKFSGPDWVAVNAWPRDMRPFGV